MDGESFEICILKWLKLSTMDGESFEICISQMA